MLPHIKQTEASNIPTTSYTGLATLTYGEQYQHTAGALKVNVPETQLATSPYPSASTAPFGKYLSDRKFLRIKLVDRNVVTYKPTFS
jgi:hypothetical protein